MLSQNRGGIRVLVVDGQHRIADLLAGILHMSGYDARVLYSTAESIHVAEEFGAQFLISDADIPGMDRFELTARIAQRLSGGRLRMQFAERPPRSCVTTCNVYQAVRRKGDAQPFRVVQEFRHMDELFRFLDSRSH